MKVIFLNRYFHPDFSATSQMLTDLAFFLAGAGHEVCVVTSGQRYDDAAAVLPPHERVDGVEVFRVLTSRFGRDRLLGRAVDYATFYLAAGWRLWRIARTGDVVVAKTDPPLISVPASLVARWRGARLVNWVQDVFPEVAEALGMRVLAGPQYALLRWLRTGALKRAAANVVLGQRMAEVLTRAGAPAGSMRVIPNWADKSAVQPIAAAGNPLRREWGLEGSFVVCYSGNMGRAHDFDTILDAAQRLALTATNIRFLFIGSGAQRRPVEEAARRRGLSNVLFRPYQERERLSLSLGVGDVHLVSLRPELEGYIFPSKLYGVLAAGRPTVFIGDPQGEIALLLEREGIGAAVKQGNADGLAGLLLRLAGDATLREAMGSRARRLLCERYDKGIALNAWREMLEKL